MFDHFAPDMSSQTYQNRSQIIPKMEQKSTPMAPGAALEGPGAAMAGLSTVGAPSGGVLGPSWGCLGGSLAALGAVLGDLWALLGPSWEVLELSWAVLGSLVAPSGLHFWLSGPLLGLSCTALPKICSEDCFCCSVFSSLSIRSAGLFP